MAPTPAQRQRAKTAQLAGQKKAPKAKIQRYLKSTEPQLREGPKGALLLKGIQCNQVMGHVLQELRALQAPNVKLLTKKNQITPFDDTTSLEFLTTKNDCALFAMASTNKKRPNNLIMGRTFDHQVLDMIEFGVLRFKSALRHEDYSGQIPKKRIGSKPLLLFVGDLWSAEDQPYGELQNLLIDFYRGDVVDSLVVSGLDHLILFSLMHADLNTVATSSAPTVVLHQRTYFCHLKKNPNPAAAATANPAPVPWLENCGPDFDFVVRRTQWASPELYRAARKQPEQLAKQLRAMGRKSNTKNHSTNLFGETVGRLHLVKQQITQASGRKVKALRRAEKQEAEEERAAIEEDLRHEEEAESGKKDSTEKSN